LPPTDITIEVPTEDDWPAIHRLDAAAFHQTPDEEVGAALKGIVEFPRSLVARRDGQIVGASGIYTRRMAVPGGVVPAAHVTMVAVASTARRQGVLTRFMSQLFSGALAAGEPIAVLWASEGRIYPRFGYGLASHRLSFTAATRELVLNAPTAGGTLREAAPADLRDAMVKIYDGVFPERPGWSSRAERHWDYRLADPPAWRGGGTPLRATIHEGQSGVDGYVLWRTHDQWTDAGPNGEVQVRELVAGTPEATAALWHFLLNIDLTRKVSWWTGAADDPVLYLVNEPRQLAPTWSDGLWVRILDLPAALGARRYACPVDVVLEVTDTRLESNAGRWRLTGGPATATCVATTGEADLALDIKELGASYLGGTSLGSLAAAGLVRELRPGALAATSPAFSWWRPPSMIEMF
jgi:predicted acetyltransferase